jgi:cytochrome c5
MKLPHLVRCLAVFPIAAFFASAQDAGLPPGAPLLPESALPDYEKEIDHAGLIRGWNKASLTRGEKIYQAVCHVCHGDLNLPGSIPDALRFAEGKFSHGADPHTLYQTLTRGWRLMAPQVQLVPREKYDVIHYLRETFLCAEKIRRNSSPSPTPISPPCPKATPPARSREARAVARHGLRPVPHRHLRTRRRPPPRRRRETARQRPRHHRPRFESRLQRYRRPSRRRPGGIADGRAWTVFEHDTLRLAGAWTGQGFIDWEGINFNTRHVVHPRTIGDLQFETADGPGWANPATGTFDDPRFVGPDGRRYGPLPRAWQHYRGLYRSGERTVIAYSVGDGDSRKPRSRNRSPPTPSSSARSTSAAPRAISLSASPTPAPPSRFPARPPSPRPPTPPSSPCVSPLRRHRCASPSASRKPTPIAPRSPRSPPQPPPRATSRRSPAAAPPTGPTPIETPVVRSDTKGAFAWERFTLPQSNPWRARLRPSGLDFTPDGQAALVCTWDGDVWRVSGLSENATAVSWRRIASGLFQPLGLKVRGSEIFVTCRDQLVALRDLDGDGETDFYESINSDHQVTDHFHEFAMGLQTDAAGNFYYAKSARHARTPLVPQHGTLLKISADGTKTEILANGFRAANGVCLNPDGSFFVTDQEGHWMPMNRVNRVTPGKFFGNMWSYGAPADTADSAMAPPLLWVDKAIDRSPAELLWINSAKWGALDGALLNLSYGQGRLEIVFADGTGDLRARRTLPPARS